jgi:hypothetical protein
MTAITSRIDTVSPAFTDTVLLSECDVPFLELSALCGYRMHDDDGELTIHGGQGRALYSTTRLWDEGLNARDTRRLLRFASIRVERRWPAPAVMTSLASRETTCN